MTGDRFLLGILSKIKLYNTTFKSRKVKVTPAPAYEYRQYDDFYYDPEYDAGNQSVIENLKPSTLPSDIDFLSSNSADFEYSNYPTGNHSSENVNFRTLPILQSSYTSPMMNEYLKMDKTDVTSSMTSFESQSSSSTTTAIPPVGRTFPPRLQLLIDQVKYECQKQHDNHPRMKSDAVYCNRTTDNWAGCWPDTLPGELAKIPCPPLPAFNQNEYAYRECTMNGTWFVNQSTGQKWANYTQCFVRPDEVADDTKYIYIFIGGFSLSLLMLVVSLVIFFWFRQLRCDRITIHKNLFLSYVFTGISWILYYVLAALDGDTMLANPGWCQALHVLCQYFTVCNFLWMFCEGLYLNTIMIYAFSSGKLLIVSCYIIGWAIPVILTIIYAFIRGKDEIASLDCWLQESTLQWIMYGPIVLSIGVNVLFLVNIVRLLVTKLRQMPEADQTKKATRATLILVPLLGLQYLLFPIRPERGSGLEDIYHIAVALLISLQGAFVSTMYCFCNSEVLQLLRRKWNQHKLMHQSSMRGTSVAQGNTYTTMEPVTQTNTTYYSTADNKDPPIELTKVDGQAP